MTSPGQTIEANGISRHAERPADRLAVI